MHGKFAAKGQVVNAVLVGLEAAEEVLAFCDGRPHLSPEFVRDGGYDALARVAVSRDGRTEYAEAGDWLVQGEGGLIFAMRGDVFAATFRAAR